MSVTEIHSIWEQYRNNELNNIINLPLPKTDFMKRSFAYAGPKLWSSLPNSIKSASSLVAFKRELENLDFDVLQSTYW